ncbi:MAG TPA: hypothetical protein VFU94_09400 [Conexibacter sp.]|nr:hypothetical protein [Conexibacter sp.]
MNEVIAGASRAAAARLADELGRELPGSVEAALHAKPTAAPASYADPVALGTLIVAVAQLAWSVWTERRRATPEPPPAVVERAVRVELREADTLDPALRDRVVAVVVDELIRTDERG